MMKKAKRILGSLLAIALAAAGLYALQRLLTPKYVDGVVEGAFIAEYYREEKDHDVLFVGDCEVYENFSPVVLWEKHGINSYIRGSAEQYIFQSYYLLEDTLRYEKPKVVIFNVQALQYDAARSEAYNRMTLEGMRWSRYKMAAIRASLTEGESVWEYVFPILRYHDRWSELTADDFRYWFSAKTVTHNGYYLRADVRPVESLPAVKPLGDYSFGQRAWSYLDRMAACCEKNGIELILIKAPSVWPHWYDEWDGQVKDYAEKHGLRYINFLEHMDEIGLDFTQDTYDAGQHMNVYGAEKCADYLGRILSEEVGLKDRRGEEKLAAVWREKAALYREEIQRQKAVYGIETN